VLIMPAFHSASIATKMLQELGGSTVIGPLLVGLNKPVQIVSLGAKDADIVNMAAIAAYNAHEPDRLVPQHQLFWLDRLVGEEFVHGARGTGPFRFGIVVEHHNAARDQLIIEHVEAVEMRFIDIAVDEHEAVFAPAHPGQRFGKEPFYHVAVDTVGVEECDQPSRHVHRVAELAADLEAEAERAEIGVEYPVLGKPLETVAGKEPLAGCHVPHPAAHQAGAAAAVDAALDHVTLKRQALLQKPDQRALMTLVIKPAPVLRLAGFCFHQSCDLVVVTDPEPVNPLHPPSAICGWRFGNCATFCKCCTNSNLQSAFSACSRPGGIHPPVRLQHEAPDCRIHG
jgi:hypothetical protein